MSDDRTLLVEYASGKKQKIAIPGDAKVTFSAVNPSSPGHYGNGYCVRIYKAKENQLAVLTGVTAFRDLSLKVQEQVTKSKTRTTAVVAADGRREETEYDESREWTTVEF